MVIAAPGPAYPGYPQSCYPPPMQMPEPGPEMAQRCVTVQQPPRLLVQKKVIFVKKIRQDPKLINGMREICVPHVTTDTMILRVPILTWVTQVVKEPQVTFRQETIRRPTVRCVEKTIPETKEVCQAVLCQPAPQVISVPAPHEYCCYATGPSTLNCRPTADNYQCPECPPYVPPGPISPAYPPFGGGMPMGGGGFPMGGGGFPMGGGGFPGLIRR